MSMKNAHLFLAYGGLFLIGIIENARGPVYPDLLKIFAISSVQGSWIFSVSSFTSFMMAISVGWWLAKFQDVGATRISLGLGAVAAILMGWSSLFASGFIAFLTANLLLGFSIGILTITINLLVVRNSPVHAQRRLLSALHSMYGLASLLAPAIIAFLYNKNIAWNFYFIFFGSLCIILVLTTLPTKGQDVGVRVGQSKTPIKLTILLGAALSFYVAAEVLISSRLVYYLVEHLGQSKVSAGNQLSLFFFLILIGRLASGFISDKISANNLLIFSLCCSIIMVSLGLLYDAIFLAWSGLTMSYFFPMMMNFITSKFPLYAENLLAKVMMFVGGMLTFLHLVFGQVTAHFGLQWAMGLVFCFLVLSLCVVLYINYSATFAKLGHQGQYGAIE